jgi:hypothetical protein
MSDFSNRGGWVTYAARGAAVNSTFLRVDLPVEDDPKKIRKPRDFTKTSWARWNGTSFATPKVVAALASELATGTAPPAAVKALASTGVPDPDGKLGVVLNV